MSVLIDVTDAVGTITLNRPDKLNAFADNMRLEIAHAVRDLSGDDAVRVIVITGAGRAFCAGADIGYMKTILAKEDTEAFTNLVEAGREVVTMIRASAKPVIASLNGAAAGGGANMALSCDLRIASDRASIGQTFNRIGLHPDWGGTYFLPRLVGPSKALELIFSGEMVNAQEGLRLGLFNRVVPHEELAVQTRSLALELAAKPPKAIALAKRAIYESARRNLSEMLDIELDHQRACFSTNDTKEGLQAFLDKRQPNFTGR